LENKKETKRVLFKSFWEMQRQYNKTKGFSQEEQMDFDLECL